jgi:hypothetical protein
LIFYTIILSLTCVASVFSQSLWKLASCVGKTLTFIGIRPKLMVPF